MTIEEKAERLLVTGALTVSVTEAKVKGDHGTYEVVAKHGRWWCSCPARKKPSALSMILSWKTSLPATCWISRKPSVSEMEL